MKKFANQNKSRTFVSGMRKQGSLDGIILLVISFSVINYVVSRAFACDRPTLLFLWPFLGHKKRRYFPRRYAAAPRGNRGKTPGPPPVYEEITSGLRNSRARKQRRYFLEIIRKRKGLCRQDIDLILECRGSNAIRRRRSWPASGRGGRTTCSRGRCRWRPGG